MQKWQQVSSRFGIPGDERRVSFEEVRERSPPESVADGSPPPASEGPASEPMLMGAAPGLALAIPARPVARPGSVGDVTKYLAATEQMLGGLKVAKKEKAPEERDSEAGSRDAASDAEDDLEAKPKKRKRSGLEAKPRKAPSGPVVVKHPHPEDSATLKFPGKKKRPPLYYGRFTIYIDTKTQCYRLKKAPCTVDFEHFYWKSLKPEKAWLLLVNRIKELKKV
jgi:hypothetical protein